MITILKVSRKGFHIVTIRIVDLVRNLVSVSVPNFPKSQMFTKLLETKSNMYN